ncbi:hydrolase [Mycobacterium heckeshornense]|uniref:Hydrolase n=1 Tax=Mycobacterium heckeshornense TaxID=110505 RepID=A0A2G8BA09_9MYCO|nr:CocE/NonD family hydrolase [Mycobacterium heckeshornense]KMV18222.1 hydrolase [Mycobacterium heckeshornense]MCV7034169.1 CocE/NonD family hydrolase [Mycobacterium heckeshornense]PIJ34564.1 hydrolase [Mycobacterium heckeshornense]BCO36877.1 hydrolase [Mycobacterium heckeshornense]BCQ09767.1 hydrolase [Mycobacterium heckeshornense]
MSTTFTDRAGGSLRVWLNRFGGQALGRLLRLPEATTRYTVTPVRIPMRDGVDLRADHYAPAGPPAGTLLVRGPYGRGFPFALVYGALYAARGYHVVVQSVRGTFGSGGVFEPMIHEAADGADTVAWLRHQPWFTGRFATIGLSYLGFTQWALLQDPPPELAAAVITAGPHDFSASTWGTGSFALADFLGWSDLVAHQEAHGLAWSGARQLLARRLVTRATDGLPMGEAGRTLLGTGAPWYESWLEHPDPEDPFWEPLRCPAALDRVQVPVLLFGGWQDIFIGQTLEQYRHLHRRGVDVALTVGPWTHAQLLRNGLGTITRESLGWLDCHLRGVDAPPRPGRVRVFVTGQGWLNLPDWPPSTTEHVLYLLPGGGLDSTPPTPTAPPASFRYDPADPTPTVGGRLLSPQGGYRNDESLARRDDVLCFTGATLTEDVCVHGNPVVELTHSSDNPHVDLFVRVSEVDARARSVNVTDGYRRLTDAADTVRIELDAIAHRFRAGSRIRVLVAGGCHPRFARNLGTGEPPVSGRELKPATHSVHFGASRLVLPVA